MARFVLILMFATMATGMFVIKNRVVGLEKELNSINAQIESDQGVLQVPNSVGAVQKRPLRF